ncbi:MAG: putative ATP-grasp-modified RiPP [Pseudonocardiaceae bacterium]
MIAILGDDPLSSVGVRSTPRTGGPSSATSCLATRPLVLRSLQPAPVRGLPEYVYDPRRQIATDPAGDPLGPNLKKDWTTIEGTHTDGDGGDNETYGWEEA